MPALWCDVARSRCDRLRLAVMRGPPNFKPSRAYQACMGRAGRRVLCFFGLWPFAAWTSAESPPVPPPLAVPRAAAPITIDGDLSDPGWQGAAVVDAFWETSPGDNVPPKVRTVAYLTYDDRAFYIGVRCDDPHPERIRAPYTDRDQVIGTD